MRKKTTLDCMTAACVTLVPKIKFIGAGNRTCRVEIDTVLPRPAKANSRGFGETLVGGPICEPLMLTDFVRLRYAQSLQFVTFSKGPRHTAIPQKNGRYARY